MDTKTAKAFARCVALLTAALMCEGIPEDEACDVARRAALEVGHG